MFNSYYLNSVRPVAGIQEFMKESEEFLYEIKD
jgi:hypothetical protein